MEATNDTPEEKKEEVIADEETIYTKDKAMFMLNKDVFDGRVFWKDSPTKGKVDLMIAGYYTSTKALIDQLPD